MSQCLHHRLCLSHHHIHCAGWIANCLDPQMKALQGNIDTLINKLSSPLLATIPFGGSIKSIDIIKSLKLADALP